jgi:hypothetical protein
MASVTPTPAAVRAVRTSRSIAEHCPDKNNPRTNKATPNPDLYQQLCRQELKNCGKKHTYADTQCP